MQDLPMGADGGERERPKKRPGGDRPRPTRQSRQSDALRENLRRRKQQARQRLDGEGAAPGAKKNRP